MCLQQDDNAGQTNPPGKTNTGQTNPPGETNTGDHNGANSSDKGDPEPTNSSSDPATEAEKKKEDSKKHKGRGNVSLHWKCPFPLTSKKGCVYCPPALAGFQRHLRNQHKITAGGRWPTKDEVLFGAYEKFLRSRGLYIEYRERQPNDFWSESYDEVAGSAVTNEGDGQVASAAADPAGARGLLPGVSSDDQHSERADGDAVAGVAGLTAEKTKPQLVQVLPTVLY